MDLYVERNLEEVMAEVTSEGEGESEEEEEEEEEVDDEEEEEEYDDDDEDEDEDEDDKDEPRSKQQTTKTTTMPSNKPIIRSIVNNTPIRTNAPPIQRPTLGGDLRNNIAKFFEEMSRGSNTISSIEKAKSGLSGSESESEDDSEADSFAGSSDEENDLMLTSSTATVSSTPHFPPPKRKEGMLLTQFTDEQLNRYEAYRRSGFQKSAVKKLLQSISGTTVTPTTVICIAGITKVFVGEVIETARTVMDEWNETGPIRPKHIREAHRRLKNKRIISSSQKYRKTLFTR